MNAILFCFVNYIVFLCVWCISVCLPAVPVPVLRLSGRVQQRDEPLRRRVRTLSPVRAAGVHAPHRGAESTEMGTTSRPLF